MKFFFSQRLFAVTKTIFLLNLICFSASAQMNKAPAYPLIVHDPYFSIWSFSDKLNESSTKHWTGKDQSLVGLVRVDGKIYEFIGKLRDSLGAFIKDIVPARQKSVEITATQTKYDFQCGSVNL